RRLQDERTTALVAPLYGARTAQRAVPTTAEGKGVYRLTCHSQGNEQNIHSMILFAKRALDALMGSAAVAALADATVDFNRDLRSMISETCCKCHGPDAKERPSGRKVLRLDLPESARADLGNGRHAIVPGQPERSELIRRITTTDLDDKMPPPDSGKQLTVAQVGLLKRWIQQGAEYARHWSYVKPHRSCL